MPAISLDDPRLLTPIPCILATLRKIYGADTDEEVFVKAFEECKVPEGREAYRVFIAGGSAYLPASVQCEYLECVPLVIP